MKVKENGRINVGLSIAQQTYNSIRFNAEHARDFGRFVDRAVAEYVQRHNGVDAAAHSEDARPENNEGDRAA